MSDSESEHFIKAALGPDRLCQLWKKVGSLLFSSSHLGLLFWKMIDFLFVILTNNKQKIHYFPKYQALDD